MAGFFRASFFAIAAWPFFFGTALSQQLLDETGYQPAVYGPEFSQQPPSFLESQLLQKNDELEQRIQRLEAQLNSSTARPNLTLDQALQLKECGSGGLFGSVEVTFLKPVFSGAQAAFGFPVGRTFDPGYRDDVRYSLGYITDSGIGIRGRYWSFNDDVPYRAPFAPAQMGIEAQAADLEVLLKQSFRRWDLGLSAGVRYATLEYSNPVVTLYGPGIAEFEGFGPTLSMEVKRSIGDTGLSLYGNLRGSALLGDINNRAVFLAIPAQKLRDEVMMIYENQLGFAWNYTLPNRSVLGVHAAWETQYWMNNTLSDDALGMGSNIAFTGPTVGVELRY